MRHNKNGQMSLETAGGKKETVSVAPKVKTRNSLGKGPDGKLRKRVKERYAGLKQLEDPKSSFYGSYNIIKDEIVQLFTYGLTMEQVCKVFQLQRDHVDKWLRANPDIKQEIDVCRKFADSRVVASLYEIATGNAKVYERQWEERKGKRVIKVKEKTLAANAYAAITWLSRRNPSQWAENEVIKRQLAEEFDDMTDEQLNDMVERIMNKANNDKNDAESEVQVETDFLNHETSEVDEEIAVVEQTEMKLNES